MVHILLQSGRKFVSISDDQTINLQVEIQIGSQKQYFQEKPDVPEESDDFVIWNDHLYFTLQDLTPKAAEETNVTFRALNKGFFRNEIIGEMTIPLSVIYFGQMHKIEHAWFALENPESEDLAKIFGMLKASISCRGPPDEEYKLEPQPSGEDTSTLFMSAQTKRKMKQLKINILRALDLPVFGDIAKRGKELFSANIFNAIAGSETVEPYFTCDYAKGKAVKTKPVNDFKEQINQTMFIPLITPVLNDRLTIGVWDKNEITSNMIGVIQLSIAEITARSQKGGYFVWEDIYGADAEFFSDEAMEMNKHPETGSHYKGTVLFYFELAECDKPVKTAAEMPREILRAARKIGITETKKFQMMCEVGQGVAMSSDDKYHIKIKVRSYEVTTKPTDEKIYSSYCYWNERLVKKDIELAIDPDTKDIDPDEQIFFYLMLGDQTLGWHKEPLCNFRRSNAKWKWFSFQRDTITDEIETDYECGMINVRLSFVENDFDLYSVKCWQDNLFGGFLPFTYKTATVRCYIFQCRGLPPADGDGASDPFIRIVNHTGDNVETPVIEDNLNPIFMCCRSIELRVRDPKKYNEYPPIVLSVLDEDEGFLKTTSDYLGRAVVFLGEDSSYNTSPNNDIPKPKWHKIKFGVHNDSPDCGELLCSFSVYDPSEITPYLPEEKVDLTKIIAKQEMTIDLNLLGLRGLKSSGLLPIKKAFVKLQVKSLLPPDEQLSVEDKTIQGEENGSDPNFCALINLKLNLPIKKLYTPSMTCSVLDQVFMGFSQPIVGTFQLPIGDLMQEQIGERHIFMMRAQKVVEALQDILTKGTDPDKFDGLFDDIEYQEPADSDDDQQINPNELNFEMPLSTEGILSNRTNKSKAQQALKTNLLAAVGSITKEVKPEMTKAEQTKLAKQNFLVEQKKKKEELEKANKEAEDLTKKEGWTLDETVMVPEYTEDKLLSCFRENANEYPKLFRAVGYNDQSLIQKIANQFKKLEESNDDKIKVELQAKRLANTKRHFRRYYCDELENVKTLFPKMPFKSYDIMAGQTRGASSSKGLFGFGKTQETEDGTASTLKKVGTFKGTIKIFNKEANDQFEQRKTNYVTQIKDLLDKIYRKNAAQEDLTNKPALNFQLADLETAQSRDLIDTIFGDIGCKFDELLPFLTHLSQEKSFEKQMVTSTDAVVNLYVLGAFDLASRDIGSDSDPYFTVKCGTFEWNNRDRYKLDCASPEWNEFISFAVNLPGSKPVQIQAYDYDDLFGDDLIGTTVLDLDDRWFTPNWVQLEEKPIEHRQVYHPSTLLSQGVIEMWLDVVPASKIGTASAKCWDIAPEPEQEFEVRVVVFGCKGVPEADAEGTTDAYVTAFFRRNDIQETDTHYRCTTGEPNFNYRLKFTTKTPFVKGREILTLQCWDRDLIKSNDMICQWNLDLTELIDDAKLTHKQMALEEKYFNQSLKARMYPEKPQEETKGEGKKDKKKQEMNQLHFVKKPEVGNEGRVFELRTKGQGEDFKDAEISIQLDIRVVPLESAKSNPVGLARDNPNIEPMLPEPKGRFQFSLNPIAMLNQLCGPKVRNKIWCYGCCIFWCVFCLVFGIYMLPFISSLIQLTSSIAK